MHDNVEVDVGDLVDLDSGVSTTWAWKRVKIMPPAEGQSAAARRASSQTKLSRRAMRQEINITIRLRGGEECWVEVRGRGRVWRFTGVTAVYDMLRIINRV